MMKTIGLTGGTGSGKSVVSQYLTKRDAFIIDCDKIAHGILLPKKPAYKQIIDYFGTEILDENKAIIRRKLGDIVFSNKDKLEFLNNCTHRYIGMEINEILKLKKSESGYSCIVIDAPLLIEANLIPICSNVWVVYADESIRIKRIMERDNISFEQAKNRIHNQKKWEEYEKYADVVIDNSGDLKFVETQLDKLLKSL